MRKVKRMAKPGEYIKLVENSYTFDEVGDILKVDGIDDERVYVLGKNHLRDTDDDNYRWHYYEYEYVVLENYKGEKDMKKSDLKNGAIVEIRNGDKFILLFNCLNNEKGEDLLICLNDGGYLDFDEYNDDLTFKDGNEYDIVKVCQNEYVGDNIRKHIINDTDKWTWIREEETVMSISEIEEKLGITGLKIKDED